MKSFAKSLSVLSTVALAALLVGCDADVRVDANKDAPVAVSPAGADATDGDEVLEGPAFKFQGLGVDVEVGKEGRVGVKAPGVDVQRDPKIGTSVRAPGTEVDVDGAGVRVKAPNTDVKVE